MEIIRTQRRRPGQLNFWAALPCPSLSGSPSGRDPEVSSAQNCPGSISVSVLEVGVDYFVCFETWVSCHSAQCMVLTYFVNCDWHLRDHFEVQPCSHFTPMKVQRCCGFDQAPKRTSPMGHYSTSPLESVMSSGVGEDCRSESTANHLCIFPTP